MAAMMKSAGSECICVMYPKCKDALLKPFHVPNQMFECG